MTDHPQEIRREHVYGNFRQRGRPAKKASKRDKRPGMSDKHLECLRKLPCCISMKMPAGEVHHLKATGERGMGLRSTDKWGLPMSHEAHMEVERVGSKNELAWFKERGIDAIDLATALWNVSGDLPKMTRVVIAHRQGK